MKHFDNTIPPQEYLQPMNPAPAPAASQISAAGNIAATLIIASALSVGSNIVDVQKGKMTLSQSFSNGIAKGGGRNPDS